MYKLSKLRQFCIHGSEHLSIVAQCRKKDQTRVEEKRQIPLIYIVDDDYDVRNSLELFLSIKGMQACAFGGGREMLAHGDAKLAQLFILDVHMPDMDGFTLLQELRRRGVKAPVILMSGLGDKEVEILATRSGAARFFNKPVEPRGLFEAVLELLAAPAA
jgi:two-component system, LuxR family, response regulator FixJ